MNDQLKIKGPWVTSFEIGHMDAPGPRGLIFMMKGAAEHGGEESLKPFFMPVELAEKFTTQLRWNLEQEKAART